ncbi:Alpha-mannosidase [Fasciolopsis buskii]|uniref:mannosyl-oligosaccharide 1,3-1,6-alpha-mannosidase n=1 Tax=Fasciolopsis buskii TaxID=27845 RepID=A0A8E0S9W3_9TREM|nr:Alpha-mannosidase [Fasciolopsis buski]
MDFTNEFGELWDEDFENKHNMSHWDSKPLEVFLVPHSHQDPGWLRTFDEYFESETRNGFNATLETLLLHPEARFIYAEVSFFSRWVSELTNEDKLKVAKLLHNGHLEIVSGGWVMPDEAVTSYYGIVDQMIEGHHWLWENFDSVKQPQIPCHLLAFSHYDVPHSCGPDPELRFATLSEYFRAFYRYHGYEPRSAAHSNLVPVRLNLSLLTGDLFTYADYNQYYWSGFFTSRPVEKFLSRVLESELRASEILYTFARYAIRRFAYSQLNNTIRLLDDGLKQARQTLGIIQHHDAVTGTSKPHVVSDYNKRLTFGLATSRLISEITASVLLLCLQEANGDGPQNSWTLNQIVSFIREWNKTVDSLAVTSIAEAYSESLAPIPYRIKIESPSKPITTTVTFHVDGTNDRYHVKFTPKVPAREYPQAVVQAELVESETGLSMRLHVGPVYLAALSLSQLIIEPFKAPNGQSVLASAIHSM